MQENKKLAVSEISAIIKACRTNGVALLKWGDFEIHLGPDASLNPKVLKPKKIKSDPVAEKAVVEKATLQANADTIDDEIATLQVEDPVEFEKMIVQGELDAQTQA